MKISPCCRVPTMKFACNSVTVSALICLGFGGLGPTTAYDNGLARTPPMGWLSWLAFFCDVDCEAHPNTCISEKLFIDVADRLVSGGYKNAGYAYVITDDCWLSSVRGAQGRLQPNATRFPHGIPWLVDYVHSKGLKFGIYEDYGTATCAGYPGVLDHMQQDAQTLVSWGVDYIKLDGCNSDASTMDKGFVEFGTYLNQTGHPIVYSCEWPLYQYVSNITSNYSFIGQHCNLWRNFYDVQSNWASILSIIDYYDAHQDIFIPAAGPGKWFDPDMLAVGNDPVTVDQAKVQMAIWSIWSAPLLISTNLRTITAEFSQILLNERVIAINQDKMGNMGRLLVKKGSVRLYSKQVLPVIRGDSSFAVAIVNTDPSNKADVSFRLGQVNLTHTSGYEVDDLFDGKSYGTLLPSDSFHCTVNPTGVVFIRASTNM